MSECLFCNIVSKNIPADIVYEDEHTLAFLDINPVNPGHTLVVPKTHAESLFEISAESWAAVAETARRIAPAVLRATGATGMNVHMNNKRIAGQLVDHVHLHLIPRHETDGLKHWHGSPYAEGASAHVREQIRAALS